MLHQFFLALAVSLMPLSGQAMQSHPYIDVLIPAGMPIKVDVHRDETEPGIFKYDITRIVARDAQRAKITIVMLDANGKIRRITPIVGGHLADPMSMAATDTSICRIVFIVEWLETDQGKWVVDTKSQQVDIESLIKPNAEPIPKARFIANN